MLLMDDKHHVQLKNLSKKKIVETDEKKVRKHMKIEKQYAFKPKRVRRNAVIFKFHFFLLLTFGWLGWQLFVRSLDRFHASEHGHNK